MFPLYVDVWVQNGSQLNTRTEILSRSFPFERHLLEMAVAKVLKPNDMFALNAILLSINDGLHYLLVVSFRNPSIFDRKIVLVFKGVVH